MSEEQGSGFGWFVFGFVLGGIVGAAAALTYAPESGETTRERLRQKGIELRAQAEESYGRAMERLEELRQQAQIQIDQVRQQVEEGVQSARQYAEDVTAQMQPKAEELAAETDVAVEPESDEDA